MLRMGCSTSRDAITAARPRAPSRARRPRPPVMLCRERAALARAVADRRSALAAAHADYFRSLVAVGATLRLFAVAALAEPAFADPPSPVADAAATTATGSPLSHSSTVSQLSHSLSEENLSAPCHNAGGGEKASSSKTTRRFMRSSSTVSAVVYENRYARPQYAEGEARYGYAYGNGEVLAGERPGPPPPSVSPWDIFDPFGHCDGFVEDYRSRRSLLDSSPDSAKLRKMEGIPELDEETESAAMAKRTDASSKPSTSRVAGGDQYAKTKTRCPNNAASNRTASEPAPGAGKRRVSSNYYVPNNASPKDGVKKSSASHRGSAPAPGANGGKGKAVYAVPSNGRSNSKSKQEPKEKSSPTASSGSTAVNGGSISSTGSSSTQMKKKDVVIEEVDLAGSISGGTTSDDGSCHGEPAALSAAASSPLHLGTRSVAAAMNEVYWLFNEAANRGVAVSRVLGTGKAVIRRTKLRVRTVSISSCLPKPRGGKSRASRSKRSTSSSSLFGAARTNDVHKLSSTLEKLWVWEKKLYRETKDKKKLRKQYKKMQRRLKSLAKRGAEPSALDSSQMSVSLLRSKISVSTSTANVLSLMIEKIRDEELYPELADLIQRFRALWKAVLECHGRQVSAVLGTEFHQLMAVTLSQSGAASMASKGLERELKNWRHCFERWIGSQRSFVEALNGWLKEWLPEEEDAPDGVPQLAPPAFVISNTWLRATEKVPTAKALGAMDHFAKLVHELNRSQEDEHRHKEKADRASMEYHTKHEDLKAAFGLITDLDVVAVVENPNYRHHDRVRDLVKAGRRRGEERARHYENLQHAHTAASATLPLGLVPMLQQIVGFFEGSLQAYTEI